MKKIFSLILVAMLALCPICAYATEDTPDQTPTVVEDEPTPASTEDPTPIESEPATDENTEVSVPIDSEPAADTNTEIPTSETPIPEVPAQDNLTDDNIDTETPPSKPSDANYLKEDNSNEMKETEENLSDPNSGEDKKAGNTSDESSTEDTENTDNAKNTDLTEESKEKKADLVKLNNDLEALDEQLEDKKNNKEKTLPLQHEHEFEYISNKDGTHIVRCIAPVILEKEDGADGDTEEFSCDYELEEECSYDEDGVCIYCKDVKPKKEPLFDPSVSISIENTSCKIGETNPIICMNISSEDFDIAYAQICFANYSKNQFINWGLSQGKYFDYKENNFVHTENSNWYASPDITNDYDPGEYSVRSVYIRSTTGEDVHYSIESGSLSEGYENYSIELVLPTSMSLIKDLYPASDDETPVDESSSIGEDVFIEPEELESIFEAPIIDEESIIDEEPIIETTTNEEPVIAEQPTNEEYVIEKKPTNENELAKEEPTLKETTVLAPQTEEKINENQKTETAKEVLAPPVTEPKIEENPKIEESKTIEAPKSTNNTKSNTDNQSNTKQGNNSNTTSNTILNFLKKLFGLK